MPRLPLRCAAPIVSVMAYRRSPPSSAFDPFGIASKKRQAQEAPRHACASPGCDQPGEYRAPTDRRLADYKWLCLEHIREHNQKWNFYEGMSQEQLEEEIRKDSCWQRPTWKLGALGAQGPGSQAWNDHVRDDLGIFDRDRRQAEADRRRRRDDAERQARQQARQRRSGGETIEEKALRILDIEPPFTRETLRARYLLLVKKNHPDVNHGDPLAEERLKDINEAYKILLKAVNT